MKITVLDKAAMGADTPFERLSTLGEVTSYDATDAREVYERVSDAEVLILNKVKITHDVICAAKNLKLICVFATGFDNIDIRAAKEKGIAVCNVPGYSTDSVALFTVSIALSLFTHLREYNNYVTSGRYSASSSANRLIPVYHELKGKTWGIIGLGNIGKAVAKIAEAFGMNVLAYKRKPTIEYTCTDLATLCKTSDIISVHCPLNEGTRSMINKETISLMKNSVVIVNAARGAVINDEDIVDAVINGRIGAFGSDVYTSEPFGEDHPFYRIMKLENVLLTPHSAWGAYEARERCINIICDNICAFERGEKLNRVDI